MLWSDTAKNLMLEAMDESVSTGAKYGSLHSAYSASGANELTGGGPAYARKALTWGPAASGAKALAATLPTWDVPAGAVVRWIGLWDALTNGTFLGMVPASGSGLKEFALDDVAADTLKSEAHGFSNGDAVVVWGPQLPTDVAVGTIYYVVSAATDTLKLSATSGGAAIDFADKGQGFLQKLVPETFGGQGTFAVQSLSVNLGAVA